MFAQGGGQGGGEPGRIGVGTGTGGGWEGAIYEGKLRNKA